MGAVIAGRSTEQFRTDYDLRTVLPPPPDLPEVEKTTPLLREFYGYGLYATSPDMGTFRKSPIEDPLRKLESLQCERVLSTDEESIDDVSSLASFDTNSSLAEEPQGWCQVCDSPWCDGSTCPEAKKPRRNYKYTKKRSSVLGKQSCYFKALLVKLGLTEGVIDDAVARAEAIRVVPVEPGGVFDDPERFRRAGDIYVQVSKMMMARSKLTDQDIRMLGELDFLQTFLRIECEPIRDEKEALQVLRKEKPEMCQEKLAKGHYHCELQTAKLVLNRILYGAWRKGGAASLIDTEASVPVRLIPVIGATVNSEDRAAVEYLLAEERLAALESASEDGGLRKCTCGAVFSDQRSALAHLNERGSCYRLHVLDLIPNNEKFPCRGCHRPLCRRGAEDPFLNKYNRDVHEQGRKFSTEACRTCGKGPSEVAFKFYIMKGTENYGLRYSKCVQCLEVRNTKEKRKGNYRHRWLESLGAMLKNADDNSPIAFDDKVHGIVIRDKTALPGVLEQFGLSKKYTSFTQRLISYGFHSRRGSNAWVNPDVASLDDILAMETTAPKKRKAA